MINESDKKIYFPITFNEQMAWIGIYHAWSLARDAYYKAVAQLEKNHLEDIDRYGESSVKYKVSHEKIMVNIFDETTGKWQYNVEPETIFQRN